MGNGQRFRHIQTQHIIEVSKVSKHNIAERKPYNNEKGTTTKTWQAILVKMFNKYTI